MLDLIRHFLFFNPSQRCSADTALRHRFFTETDEPTVHHIASSNSAEPITPPDNKHDLQAKAIREITPFDLLSIPRSPYQICPDWNTEHPVSRYGRLCSAMNEESRRSVSRAHLHEERPTTPIDNNAWLTQSRPIYSSHQKVHPVTDRPDSSHLWNKYNYASHQRPSTPVVVEHVGHHNNNVPVASTKRYFSISDELDTHRRLGHHLHHHHNDTNHSHRPPTSSGTGNNTSFSLDRIPHYGNQLIKWAPPQQFSSHHEPPTRHNNPHKSYHHPLHLDHHPTPHNHHNHHHSYHQQEHEDTADSARPPSRRCRSPAPFSSQLMNHKYNTSTFSSTTTNNSSASTSSAIKSWTPAAVTTTSVNTEKVMKDGNSNSNEYIPHWAHRKSDEKPQSTHRFNLWVPDTEEEDDEEEKEDLNNNGRLVVLAVAK
jgi:hypothetical protein